MLHLIAGMKNEQVKKLLKNDFDTIISEYQIRSKAKILSREYVTINGRDHRIQALEQLVCYNPGNITAKLSLTREYFQSPLTYVLGYTLLREIEENISCEDSYTITRLLQEQNYSCFIDQRERHPHNDEETAERIRIIHHYLDLEQLLEQLSTSKALHELLLQCYASVLLQNNQQALHFFREIEQHYTESIMLNTLYERRLKAVGLFAEAAEKRTAFNAWLLSEDIQLQRMSDACRSVVAIEHPEYPFVSSTVLAIRTNNYDEAVRERNDLLQVKQLIQGRAEFDVVTSTGIEQVDEKYLHLMKRNHGEVLLAQIEDKTYTNKMQLLLTTAEYLALLHYHLPSLQQSNTFIVQQLASKLVTGLTSALQESSSTISIDEELHTSLLNMCNVFQHAVIGYNKDAHPQNWHVEWRITQKTPQQRHVIVALDFQQKELTPLACDLANLVSYGCYTTAAEDKNITDNYYTYFASYGNALSSIVTPDQFYFQLLHGILYRSLRFFTAWHQPRKAALLSRLPLVLQKALSSLHTIQTNYKQHYQNNLPCYIRLQQLLQALYNHTSTKLT